MNQLLTMFKQNPSVELVQREGRQLRINAEAREKARQEAEARRIEHERQALEERSRLMAEQERQRKAEYANFGGQYKTIFKESFPRFIEYLFNNPAYHDVHSSAQTKASVIYDIMRQVERPDSVVTRETAKDPQKVLDLVRYILDA
ncbi:hypothetical protein [Evansella clarkii]|uniref:hypothetical protein n=1 Tax=Evansella clarkii TaxID=79879 RepID=UPI000996A3FF|nr:hypothetical protein [Evansella clarkii]